jgi:outer membrane protein TolC
MAFRGIRSWTALSASAVMMLVAPLGAQQPGKPAPQTTMAFQSPAPPQAGSVLQLSMEQAVQMAVENNIALKAQRLNRDIAAEGVAGAQAAFKPTIGGSTGWRNAQFLPSSFTDLSSGTISQTNVNGSASVVQTLPWYGGNYSASWSSGRVTTTSLNPTFNPSLTSGVTLTFNQPLLRGFGIDSQRATLDNSHTQQQIVNLDVELQTISLQNTVRFAYVGLIAAKAQLDVAKRNYDVAKKQYDNNQAQVAVGVAAPVDVIQADVAVKSNEGAVIQSEAAVQTAIDNLRTLILDPNRPDFWDVQIDATDEIGVVPHDIDLDAAVKNALANRLDLLEARRNLEITQRNVKLDHDLTKVALNAQAQYSAGSNGGTQFQFDGTTPQKVGAKSFSSVLGETFGGSYPTWAAGVTVSYPLGKSSAEASLASVRLQEQQQLLSIHNLEVQVSQQVRQAARDVQTNFKRVQSARAALDASQKQVDAEVRKQEVGLSDTFTLLQKQNIQANAAVQELQARIDYNNALLTFERVQKVR